MKKIILFSVLSIMALLYSCNKDIEIESGYQVNVTIDPSEVIGAFVPCHDDDFDMLDGDILRINLFVYDEEGKLVEELHGKCRDYSQKIDFSFKLPFGDYTFVATSDVYNSDIDFENWSYTNVGEIDEFQIEQSWYEGMDCVLGLKIITDKIVEPRNIQINLTSATALIVCNMSHVHDDNEIFEGILEFERYCISTDGERKFNDKVGIGYDEFIWLPAPSGYYYHLFQLRPQNWIGYDGTIYNYVNILPVTTQLLITCDVTNLETGETEFGPYPYIESISATFKSGEQYDLNVDLRECLFEITKTSGNNKRQVDLVKNSDKVNKHESMRLMDLINNNPNLKLNNLSK